MNAIYYQQHRAHLRAYANRYRREHRDNIREMNRRSYLKHRKARIEKVQDYRSKNVERIAAYKAKWYRRNRSKLIKRFRKNHRSNPQAAKARRLLRRAVKAGRILKPLNCSICGRKKRLEGHHHRGYDNDHALDVMWVCRGCHIILEPRNYIRV